MITNYYNIVITLTKKHLGEIWETKFGLGDKSGQKPGFGDNVVDKAFVSS
jgi:hypothetical protein